MQKSRKLYGSIISPFVRKVLIALYFKNLTFEIETLIPFKDSDRSKILTLNPLGKVPIYQEDNFIIPDSSVICAYLDKEYPEHPLYPTDAKHYAQCLWYEKYADVQLIPTLAIVFFNTTVASLFNRTPDMLAVKTALEIKLPEIFNYLDQEVSNKKYLIDDHFSIADISIVSAFINFEFSGYTVDSIRWKNLSRYISGISEEKCVADAFSQARERFKTVATFPPLLQKNLYQKLQKLYAQIAKKLLWEKILSLKR